jgi:hypothetical protein
LRIAEAITEAKPTVKVATNFENAATEVGNDAEGFKESCNKLGKCCNGLIE